MTSKEKAIEEIEILKKRIKDLIKEFNLTYYDFHKENLNKYSSEYYRLMMSILKREEEN